jgi:hypothetical protein
MNRARFPCEIQKVTGITEIMEITEITGNENQISLKLRRESLKISGHHASA